MAELPPPDEGIVLTHFIVSDDVERSRRFYTEVLGGSVVFSGESGEPTNVALSNSFIVISVGGGPTDDKPSVTLETPPDPDRISSFVNIRVKDIAAVYAEWGAKGANFLTPPKQHQHEIRCYIRDPDGHLIEVGQTHRPRGLDPASVAVECACRGVPVNADPTDADRGPVAPFVRPRRGVIQETPNSPNSRPGVTLRREGRVRLRIPAEPVAGWWPCGYSSRDETGAWPPLGARCPGRPSTRASARFREGVPTDDFSSIRWSWFT